MTSVYILLWLSVFPLFGAVVAYLLVRQARMKASYERLFATYKDESAHAIGKTRIASELTDLQCLVLHEEALHRLDPDAARRINIRLEKLASEVLEGRKPFERPKPKPATESLANNQAAAGVPAFTDAGMFWTEQEPKQVEPLFDLGRSYTSGDNSILE